MAQLLLQQGKVTEALKYFERAAELSRTEGEIVNALSYAEATRTQLEVSSGLRQPHRSISNHALDHRLTVLVQVQEKYPQLSSRLQGMGAGLGGPAPR